MMMGDDDDDDEHNINSKQHTITLASTDIYMCVFTVKS